MSPIPVVWDGIRPFRCSTFWGMCPRAGSTPAITSLLVVGDTFAAVQVRATVREVKSALRSVMEREDLVPAADGQDADRELQLEKSGRGWVMVTDGSFSPNELARQLSGHLGVPAVAYSAFESDNLAVDLVVAGTVATQVEVGGGPEGDREPQRVGTDWASVLSTGTVDDLAMVFRGSAASAQHALYDAGRLFGWNSATIDPREGGERRPNRQVLRYVRRQPAEWEALRAGPPSFAWDGQALVNFGGAVGASFRDRALFGVRCNGGPGRGVRVTFSGSAVAASLLEIEQVVVRCASEVVEGVRDEHPLELTSGSETELVYEAGAVRLQPGFAKEGKELPIYGPDYPRIRKLLARRQHFFEVAAICRQPGEAELDVLITPLGGSGPTFSFPVVVTAAR